jgi:hypothetical protein
MIQQDMFGNDTYFGSMMVTDMQELPDGSANVHLNMTSDQVQALMSVFIRAAIVEGLNQTEQKTKDFSTNLSIVNKVRDVMEAITLWETSDDYDWTPNVGPKVQELRELLSKT